MPLISSFDSDLPPDVAKLVAPPLGEVAVRGLTAGTGEPHDFANLRHWDLRARDALVSGLESGEADSEAASTLTISGSTLVLNQWAIQSHSYSSSSSGRLAIFAGLIGGGGKVIKAGAVDEAKWFCRTATDDHKPVDMGVAVRLLAATTNWEVDAALTVPNIAAAAQLKRSVSDAYVGISVVGYSGPLGDLLPAPRQLDVTTLSNYLVAFAKIQELVFGENGRDFITPAALWYDDGQSSSAAPSS